MLSEKDVRYVAGLSRIHIEEKDLKKFTSELENIISYINKLEELDISDIEPTSHALPIKNVFRDDVIKESLGQKNALKISKEKEKGAFKVPKVIE